MRALACLVLAACSEAGDLSAALATEELAMQWYAERRPNPDILERLRIYRELRARQAGLDGVIGAPTF